MPTSGEMYVSFGIQDVSVTCLLEKAGVSESVWQSIHSKRDTLQQALSQAFEQVSTFSSQNCVESVKSAVDHSRQVSRSLAEFTVSKANKAVNTICDATGLYPMELAIVSGGLILTTTSFVYIYKQRQQKPSKTVRFRSSTKKIDGNGVETEDICVEDLFPGVFDDHKNIRTSTPRKFDPTIDRLGKNDAELSKPAHQYLYREASFDEHTPFFPPFQSHTKHSSGDLFDDYDWTGFHFNTPPPLGGPFHNELPESPEKNKCLREVDFFIGSGDNLEDTISTYHSAVEGNFERSGYITSDSETSGSFDESVSDCSLMSEDVMHGDIYVEMHTCDNTPVGVKRVTELDEVDLISMSPAGRHNSFDALTNSRDILETPATKVKVGRWGSLRRKARGLSYRLILNSSKPLSPKPATISNRKNA